MDEYVSDELTSGSEDQKQLKKANDAANRKQRQATQARNGCGQKREPKPSFISSTDQQLFRGEPTYSIILQFVCFSSSIACFLLFLQVGVI